MNDTDFQELNHETLEQMMRDKYNRKIPYSTGQRLRCGALLDIIRLNPNAITPPTERGFWMRKTCPDCKEPLDSQYYYGYSAKYYWCPKCDYDYAQGIH